MKKVIKAIKFITLGSTLIVFGMVAWYVFIGPIALLDYAYAQTARVFPQIEWILTVNPTVRHALGFATGSDRHDFLTTSHYDSIVVEINAIPGYELPDEEIEYFKTVIESCCSKPQGVRFTEKPLFLGPENKIVNESQIFTLIYGLESEVPRPREKLLRIVILDNIDTELDLVENETAGLAITPDTIVILADTITNSTKLGGATENIYYQAARRSLLTHEFGHILGLAHANYELPCAMSPYITSGNIGNISSYMDTIFQTLVEKYDEKAAKNLFFERLGTNFCSDELQELERYKRPFTPSSLSLTGI